MCLAAAARSRLSAFFMIALPITPAVAFVGYLIGNFVGFDDLGWALAALAILEVPRSTDRWQRERQLAAETQRAASISPETSGLGPSRVGLCRVMMPLADAVW
jgi:hypothetical protein